MKGKVNSTWPLSAEFPLFFGGLPHFRLPFLLHLGGALAIVAPDHAFGFRRALGLFVFLQLFLGGVLGPAVRAIAAESGADELIVRGLELRRKGNEQAALPLFREAYKKSQSARSAGQLGLCHQALGQWAEAETYLTAALDKTSDPWMVKNLAVIETALGTVRLHVGRVEIVGDPMGAEVSINGNVVGKLPLALPVPVSNGEVEVHLPGYVTKTKAFHLDGGQYQRIVVHLERQGPPPVIGASDSPPAAVVGTSAAAPPSAPEEVAIERGPATGEKSDGGSDVPSTMRRSLKWVAWGVGAVSVGIGVYGVLSNRSRVREFDAGCRIGSDGKPMSDQVGVSNAECSRRKSAYESATVVAVGGLGRSGYADRWGGAWGELHGGLLRAGEPGWQNHHHVGDARCGHLRWIRQ